MKSTDLPIEISVVSPVYRGEKTLQELLRRIHHSLEPLQVPYEIVLVDDGSPDQSWREVSLAAQEDTRVVGIKLTRNFGQHQAITAGLAAARGNFAVVIDCDLQEDPKYIPLLYQKAKAGCPVVFTLKKNRAHGILKNITAKAFEAVFNWLIQEERFFTRAGVGTYSMLSRKAIDSFLKISDYHRHYLMVVRWLGFQEEYVEVEHQPRAHGKSNYNFKRLVVHAINGITSQSLKLLHSSILLGFSFVLMSVLGAIFFIYSYFAHGSQPGWTSLMVLVLLSTGCILLSLGVTGLYLGKVFDQVRNRPLFLVDEALNLDSMARLESAEKQ